MRSNSLRPLAEDDAYEHEIDMALVRLRQKMPYETQTNVIVYLLGEERPGFGTAAFPWPALIEIDQTLTEYQVPGDINVVAQVPLTLVQFETLHLMATMRLLAAHRELVKGAWATEQEGRKLVSDRHNAYRVYQALESIKPLIPPIFTA